MDFGDILAEWENQKKDAPQKEKSAQVSHKKANAPSKEEKEAQKLKKESADDFENQNSPKINPMELWLRRYGTFDKDKVIEQSAEAKKMADREYLRQMRSEARIDLHGLTKDEAWTKLEQFVGDCVRRGFKKIEIVHGKGIHSSGSDPVLGPMVKMFIEQNRHLGASGKNDRAHGGSGVTWVLLK